MAAKHTFTFVVEGISLSDSQQAAISKAVGEAGASALSDAVAPNVRTVIGPYFLKYRGRPAYDYALAEQTSLGELVKVSEQGLGQLSEAR